MPVSLKRISKTFSVMEDEVYKEYREWARK